MYTETELKVKTGLHFVLIDPVPMYKGVWEGCILAPFVLSFYINYVKSFVYNQSYHMPKILNRENILL